jgi:hypothetical protein
MQIEYELCPFHCAVNYVYMVFSGVTVLRSSLLMATSKAYLSETQWS